MAERNFSQEEKARIRNAIREAELRTSGEVVVHIENRCKEDVLDRAAGVFDMLELQKTKERNGVLFYLAMKDHKFAILGDGGINEKVGNAFWNEVKDLMQAEFRNGAFTEGLCKGIGLAGEKLAEHFPYQKDDVNELSDDISFGE